MCTVPTFKCSCYYVCVYVYRFVPYHGMVALACGYVVAVKQFHPDSVAFPPPAPPTLRVKVEKYLSETDHIPSLSLSHTHTLTHTLTCIHLHNCTHTHTHTHSTSHWSLSPLCSSLPFSNWSRTPSAGWLSVVQSQRGYTSDSTKRGTKVSVVTCQRASLLPHSFPR